MNKFFLLKNIIITVIFLCSQIIFAQGYYKQHELTVATPNTAELGKYGFSEISKYTGIPNISIPIYELDFDGLKIPLALSYHAGGIKVSQESSWVGLGWNLTANAVITRSINQVSDIGSRKGGTSSRTGDYGYCFDQELPTTFNSAYQDYLNKYKGLYQADTQPDIFVANLFGKTVKFILTQRESDTSPIPSERRIKTKIIDGSNVKISYNSYYKNFRITDENGFTYFFDKKEYSTNVYNYHADRFYYDENCDGCLEFSFEKDMHIISGWYVRSITSPHGKKLDFNYYLDGEESSYFISISQPNHNQTRTDTVCAEGQLDPGVEKNEAVNVPSQTVQENAYLKDITDRSNGNRIVFKLGDREDLINSDTWNGGPGVPCRLPGYVYPCLNDGIKNPKKLNEIQVINSRGQIVKKIQFSHSYFENEQYSGERKEANLRLKLDAVSIDNMTYEFRYNQPTDLPKKTSKDFDFFGFYNGAQNESIYPSLSIEDKCYNGTDFNYENNDSKRGSDFAYGSIGLLNEIIYPTKGSSQYFYESNSITMDPVEMPYTYSLLLSNNLEAGYPKNADAFGNLKTFKVGGARIAKIIDKDHTGQVTKVRNYTYEKSASNNILYSNGVLMNRMIYHNIGDGKDSRGTDYTNVTINSRNALGTENAAQGNHLGYSQVEEIITNNSDNDDIGRIVTEFINKPNETARSEEYILIDAPPYHFEAENGDLISETIFDAQNAVKSKTTYQYDYKRTEVAHAYKIFYINLRATFGNCDLNQCVPVTYKQVLFYYPFNVYETINLNTTVHKETYENGGLIQQHTFNAYNEKNLLASSEITSSVSNDKYRNETYYPFDREYNINLLPSVSSLYDDNRITTPIYIREYKNDNLLKHTLYAYGNFDGLILPSAIKENKTDISLAQMDTRVNFVDYDDYGNLLEISRPGSASTSYVWGYENQHLVAKLQNLSQSDQDVYEIIDQYKIRNSKTNSGMMLSELQKLRSNFTDAIVSTYSYLPLTGVHKMVDSRNYMTSYQYDTNERLVAILDQDNHLIMENEYNYKNQIDECLDCGSEISISSTSYQNSPNTTVRFTTDISNIDDYTSKWELDFGDGEVLEGNGSPASFYNHSYSDVGLKVVKLYAYKNSDEFLTTNVNVLIAEPEEPDPLPGGDVYFGNIVTSGPNPSTGRLYGDPGSIVTYVVTCGGANNAQSGTATVNGVTTSVQWQETSNEKTVQLPASGYVNCSVRHWSSDGTSQGGTTLRIVKTNKGQIGSPSSLGDQFF